MGRGEKSRVVWSDASLQWGWDPCAQAHKGTEPHSRGSANQMPDVQRREAPRAARGETSSPRLGQWMMLKHQLLQPFLQHVRINLRRRDIRMSQQLLDNAQVRTTVQQM